jgi:hypothetical protein
MITPEPGVAGSLLPYVKIPGVKTPTNQVGGKKDRTDGEFEIAHARTN